MQPQQEEQVEHIELLYEIVKVVVKTKNRSETFGRNRFGEDRFDQNIFDQNRIDPSKFEHIPPKRIPSKQILQKQIRPYLTMAT